MFPVKQISVESTGSTALQRDPFERVGREVVLSGFASKARRWSGPPIELMRIERAPRIAKAPAQGLPAVNSGKDMSESTPNMLPSIDQGGGVQNNESKAASRLATHPSQGLNSPQQSLTTRTTGD